MRKHSKKLLTVLLAIVMMIGVMAVPALAETDEWPANLPKPDMERLQRELNDLRARKAQEAFPDTADLPLYNEEVRLIISLEAPSLAEGAAQYAVASSQRSVREQVLAITGGKVLNEFSYLANGFSVMAKRNDIAKIRNIKGVRHVEEATLFYPDMATAVGMTQADSLWEAPFNLKGDGIVISIIDTGIDHESQDMQVDAGTSVKLTEEKVNGLIESQGLPGKYYSEKVPYGFNYADKNDTIIDLVQGEHGMHVAGISAGNGAETTDFRGVAPNAQVLAMKVFSNGEEGGAWSDDILIAIEDSVKLGADIINMSLGSPGGFYGEDSALTRTIREATDAGTLLCISAGNEGSAYDLQGNADNMFAWPNAGTVGHASTHPDALSVASVNNAKLGLAKQMFSADSAGADAAPFGAITQAEPAGGRTFKDGEYIELIPVAYDDNTKTVDAGGKDLTGKYTLVKRGGGTFQDMATASAQAGAIGCIVENNTDEHVMLGMANVELSGISALFVWQETGAVLRDVIETEGAVYVATLQNETLLVDAGPLAPSSFSSWGPTPELEFKPEIAAPGGNINSTLNGNTYGVMSGTSMSSPHMAGIAALLAEAHPELSGRERAEFIKHVSMNTALAIEDGANESIYSPRLVGAGMVNAVRAANSSVTLVNQADGRASVALKDKIAPFTLEFKNADSIPHTFRYVNGPVYTYDPGSSPMSDVALEGAMAEVSQESITVPAGGTATVTVTLTLPDELESNFAEGYIRFACEDEAESSQPGLSIPYLGYVGSWGDDYPILDFPEGMPNPLGISSSILGFFFGARVVTPPADLPRLYYLLSSTALYSYSEALELEVLPGNLWDWLSGAEPYNMETTGFDNAIDPESSEAKYVYTDVFPRIGALSGAPQVKASILNEEGEELRVLGHPEGIRRSPFGSIAGGKRAPYLYPQYGWDGTLYEASNGSLKKAPEGQYYYKLSARVSDSYDWQDTYLPVKIDNTAPVVPELGFQFVSSDGPNELKLVYEGVTDGEGTGIDVGGIVAAFMLDDGSLVAFDPSNGTGSLTLEDGTLTLHITNLDYYDTADTIALILGVPDYAGHLATGVIFGSRDQQITVKEYDVDSEDNVISYPPPRGIVAYDADQLEALGFTQESVAFEISSGSGLFGSTFRVNDTLTADETGRVTFPVAPDQLSTLIDLKVDALDAENKVVATNSSAKLLVDVTPPTLAPEQMPEFNTDGIPYLRVDAATGTLTLTGKVSDDVKDLPCTLLLNDGTGFRDPIELSSDGGTFTIDNLAVTGSPVFMAVFDYAGNMSDMLFFMVIDADGSPDELPDAPEVMPNVTVTTPIYQDLLSSSYAFVRGEEDAPEPFEFKLEGTYEGPVVQILFDDIEADLADDGTWSVTLPLEQGVNFFRYRAILADKSEMGELKLRIFYDCELPNAVFATDPQAREGDFIVPEPADAFDPGDGDPMLIWTNQEETDVKVFGTISDNTVGYQLYVNADLIVERGDIDEPGNDFITEAQPFETVVKGAKALDFITVRYNDLIDFGDDGFTQKYQIRFDDQKPTLAVYVSESAKPEPDNAWVELEPESVYPVESGVILKLEADDDLDENPTKEIYVDGERYDGTPLEPGIHSLRFIVTDHAGNTTEYLDIITIQGDPVLDVSGVPTVISIADAATFNPLDGAVAFDAVDGDLTDVIIVNPSGIHMGMPGDYTFIYLVTNSASRVVSARVTVTVKDLPELLGVRAKVTVTAGDDFDPFDGVSAFDADGNDISDRIVVSGAYDPSKPGTYELVFTVTDQWGGTVTKTMRLVVKEKSAEPDKPVTPIPVDPEKPVTPTTPSVGETGLPIALISVLLLAGAALLLLRKKAEDK